MGKEDMFLYWGSGSPPCIKVMIALEEKGLSGYGQKRLDFSKKEQKGEEVVALNPRATLPTFRDGDAILNESIGIIHYLQSQYPDSGVNLLPGDAAQQAHVLGRFYEANGSLHGKLIQFFTLKFSPDPPAEELKKKGEALVEEVKIFNGHLEKDAFLAGDVFTMADIELLTILIVLDRQGLKMEGRFDNLLAYWNRNKDRPSVVAAYPPHYKTGDSPLYFKDL